MDYFKETVTLRPHKKLLLMVEIRGRSPNITNFEKDVHSIDFERGDEIDIRVDTSGKALSAKNKMYLQTAGLERVVKVGDTLIFDTGLKTIIYEENDSVFRVRCKEDGFVDSNSTVTVPEKHSSLPIIKDEDISDLKNLSKIQRIDFISLPFVTCKEDINEVRKRLPFMDNAAVVSRIDDRKALDDFWEITNSSAGIILNRASLAHSVQSEKLFAVIKFFIE